MANWKELGKTKAASVNSLIPKSWLLTSPLPSVEQQRDFTGKYIQSYLSPKEIEITETDAVGIVQKTTTGIWKAREVAEAFCHRAALAHQMVWNTDTLFVFLSHFIPPSFNEPIQIARFSAKVDHFAMLAPLRYLSLFDCTLRNFMWLQRAIINI